MNLLFPGQSFHLMAALEAKEKAWVRVTDPDQKRIYHPFIAPEAGVIARLTINSTPRDWSPKMIWPDGFTQICRVFQEDHVHVGTDGVDMYQSMIQDLRALVGFLPNRSKFLADYMRSLCV